MWQQVYNPLQAPVLSALVAAIPILFFLLGLTVLKLSGVRAALGALVLALGIGIPVFSMPVGVGVGAIGIPVSNGAEKGGVALAALSTDMVFVLQIFAILCPVVMVMLQDGLRGLRQTGVVALITGAVFGGGQSLMLLVLALIMQFWSPSHVFREPGAPCPESVQELKQKRQTFMGIVRAWSPFIFLSVTILLWSTVLKPVFAPGGALGFASFSFGMPGVHQAIQQMPPIVATPKAVEAVYTWNILGASGTAILVAAIVTILTARITWREAFEELHATRQQLQLPILMICLVMAVANVMNYSGMISAIALAVAAAGTVFPLLSPVIGWIGVFVTGSVVNNNTLFAGLQATTAQQIGVSQSLLVAANTAGGVAAKIVSPQSIAIAAAAVGSAGQESTITSMGFRYSIILLLLMCGWVYLLSLMVGG
jgi:L-lactate permease